jgi:hypothetical protein
MSSIPANELATASAAYKWRERILIAGALALVVCRLISVKHSVAAMVIATLVLAAVFTGYVRGWPWGRRWAFRVTLPVTLVANTAALAVGVLVTVLAETGLLVHNHLGEHVEWNRPFVCVPIAAAVNLLALAWPNTDWRLRGAAWLANGLAMVYAGSFWSVHESFERFGGAPPFGADLIAALATISMMALAWDDAPRRDRADGPSRRKIRPLFAVAVTATTAVAMAPAIYTVVRRCRLDAAVTSLGCEVTDRTRRIAPLRIRELAPLRPYVTEIEAVYIPKDALTADTCDTVADVLGKLELLDEVEAAAVPAGCGGLFQRLPPGSLVQYVTLSGEGVNDDTLADVGRFKRLRKVALVDAQVSDDGLNNLSRLRWLDVLILRGAPLSGDGLAHLTSLPSLTSLDLADTAVDDDQVGALTALTGLTYLDLRGTNVTINGVQRIQAGLPRCQITWGPSSR